MKKILLSLLAVMISFTALAQTDGDKITINNSEGKQAEWNLTGESNTVSSMKHNANNQLEIYLKGLEDFGAWETYDINKINNVVFSIYHESEVGDVLSRDIDQARHLGLKRPCQHDAIDLVVAGDLELLPVSAFQETLQQVVLDDVSVEIGNVVDLRNDTIVAKVPARFLRQQRRQGVVGAIRLEHRRQALACIIRCRVDRDRVAVHVDGYEVADVLRDIAGNVDRNRSFRGPSHDHGATDALPGQVHLGRHLGEGSVVRL